MNRPCPSIVTCPGSDDPITNYSSEQTDTLDFVSMFWRGAAFPGALPLGVPWSLNACGAIITGTNTQIETELEAIIAAINCDFQNKYGNGPGAIPGTPNDAQICCQAIPGTATRCYTIHAGMLVALNKASANQIASALACYQVNRSAMTLRDLDSSTAQVGQDYLDAIDALGGFGMVTFNIIGTTPPGLVFEDVGGGVLTVDGTPTQDGVFSFVVTAQDSLGTRVQKTYTITVAPAPCLTFFTNLFGPNWVATNVPGGAPGTSASSFQNGAHFELNAVGVNVPPVPPPPGYSGSQVQVVTGWNGPAMNCKLTLSITAGGLFTNSLYFQLANNNPPFDVIDIIPFTNPGPGTHVYPLTIPAVTGYTVFFNCGLTVGADGFGNFGAGFAAATGDFGAS